MGAYERTMLVLIIAILLTCGIATLIADYDGPFSLFTKLRTSRIGKLFDCNVCLVPYIALIPLVGLHLTLMEYLAVVGASVLLARQV